MSYFALYSTVIITFVVKDLNILIDLDFIFLCLQYLSCI